MKVRPTYTEKDYKIAKELSESKQKDRVLPRKYALRWGDAGLCCKYICQLAFLIDTDYLF